MLLESQISQAHKAMSYRTVEILLSNKVAGSYEARSYPHDNLKDDKQIELYSVPVYKILVSGSDDGGNSKSYEHQAPRFMPYWNDPKVRPDPRYSVRGWVNSGLAAARTVVVSRYLRDYEVHNRYSPGRGAIVLTGSFYIHAGPGELSDVGFGSAGCVEIIGNFDNFKAHLAYLSGSPHFAEIRERFAQAKVQHKNVPDAELVAMADDCIEDLVKHRRLIVNIQAAHVPDIRKGYTRSVPTETIREFIPRLSLPSQ